MKILALADIHGHEYIEYMVDEIKSIESFDLVLIAGDITNFGPADVAKRIINSMPKSVFAVPGNCDPPEVIDAIEKSKGTNLHFKTEKFGGLSFAGVGGVSFGFNTGITFSEDRAYQYLSKCKGCVFLLHQPPFGILDDVGGRHIGSEGIMKAVQKASPILVVSGHVHEARGYKLVNDTLFVNPGPAKEGYASIIDLNRKDVRMLSL